MKKSKKIVHWVLPGKVLAKNFMKPRGLTADQVAKEIGVQAQHINEIVQGKRKITPEIALGLERYFGWPSQEWLLLQSCYDMGVALAEVKTAHKKFKRGLPLLKMRLRSLLRSSG